MPVEPRIGLLALHWGMFDPIMPEGYRQNKEALVQRLAQKLTPHGRIIYPGLVTDEVTGTSAARSFDSKVDVIIVFPCMAAPPAFGWTVLADAPDVPVVFWNAHTTNTIPEGFGAADLVMHSSNVGTVMLTNVLLRMGRSFQIVTGRFDDSSVFKRIVCAIRAAMAASRLRRARLGVLGEVLPGYLDVAIDRVALKRDLGVELVEVTASDIEDAFRAVTDEQEKKCLAEMASWRIEGGERVDQRASARLTAALRQLTQGRKLDGGALNCHTSHFLGNPKLGVVACYAVSRLLEQGVPFTCTGDIPTALAALILKFLGTTAHYCECDLIDYEEDYMLLSNTGEGDPGISAHQEEIHVIPSEQFKKGAGCGLCLRFRLRPGTGTLVGFSPRKSARGGYVLVIARGTILDKHFPQIGAPNGGFRFQNGDTVRAFNCWCLAGATHHAVLAAGDYVEPLCEVAEFLRIEHCVI